MNWPKQNPGTVGAVSGASAEASTNRKPNYSTIDYALKYAAMGWPVFPIAQESGAYGKTTREGDPIGVNQPLNGNGGFLHATTNRDQINTWWQRWPDANIGMHPHPGRLCVVDVDVKNGDGPAQLDALQATHGELPDTLRQDSPSGGYHLAFRCDAPLSNTKIAADIDIRSANGYVAVEPSTKPVGVYAWQDWDVLSDDAPVIAELPQWVIDVQAKRSTADKPPPPAVDEDDSFDPGIAGQKFDALLADNPKAASRYNGDTSGMNDATGSAMDMSMCAMLKRNDFTMAEARYLLADWPHGSDKVARHGTRYWSRIWGKINADAPPPGSEQDLALKFADQADGWLRWTPGLDWMANTGHVWEPDATLHRYTLAKKVCADAARKTDKAKTKMVLTKASTTNAALSLARSDGRLVTPVSDWNMGTMYLNTPGGVYSLETGAQVPRDGLLFTQSAAVAPDHNMGWPIWHRFLGQVFDGDDDVIEFMQRLAGYCLTGDTREQKLFFMHGGGSNGKSVFLDTVRAIMGSYAHNLPSEALMSQRREGHATIYADLFGKRLAVSSEIEANAYWAESKIKELTGDATITARKMRQDYFTFEASHKHVIAGNYRPRLKGDDYAMARRMVLIPFNQKFEGAAKDEKLPQKLLAEYPGILAWMVDGAVKWATDGLHIPASISNASREYMAENDDIALWADECCQTGPGFETATSDLFASFQSWKEANGEHAGSVRAFSQQLAKKGYDKKRTNRGMVYIGIKPTGAAAADYMLAKQGY